MNARTTRALPAILAHLGADSPEAGNAEYWRRVDRFRDTDLAAKLWKHWERIKSIATGLSQVEADILDAAYWAAEDARIDHEALAREERRQNAKLTSRPARCGYCDAEYPDMRTAAIHEGNCSYRPELRATLAEFMKGG